MTDIPRIYSPPAANTRALAPAPGPAAPAKPASGDAPYLSKLMTMFPAEAVTVYTLGYKSLSNPLVVVIATLVAMLLVRWAAFRSGTEGKTNVMALFVSAVSFLLWVGASADLDLIHILDASATPDSVANYQKTASFFIILWTWVMPNFVKLNPA